MKEVSKEIYEKNFTAIYEWFEQHAHAMPAEDYLYQIIDLPNTHLKMVDIIRELTSGVYFRVILRATYYNVNQIETPKKNFRDLNYFFNTNTTPPASNVTATQVCFVQLDERDQPVAGILFTYSPHDENYHRFPLS